MIVLTPRIYFIFIKIFLLHLNREKGMSGRLSIQCYGGPDVFLFEITPLNICLLVTNGVRKEGTSSCIPTFVLPFNISCDKRSFLWTGEKEIKKYPDPTLTGTLTNFSPPRHQSNPWSRSPPPNKRSGLCDKHVYWTNMSLLLWTSGPLDYRNDR